MFFSQIFIWNIKYRSIFNQSILVTQLLIDFHNCKNVGFRLVKGLTHYFIVDCIVNCFIVVVAVIKQTITTLSPFLFKHFYQKIIIACL